MAVTLEQLAGIMQSSDIAGRLQGAVVLVAQAIQLESAETANHANRLKWANRAFSSPASVASAMQPAVVARYAATAIPSGLVVTDAEIQTAVADAVNTFADGQ